MHLLSCKYLDWGCPPQPKVRAEHTEYFSDILKTVGKAVTSLTIIVVFTTGKINLYTHQLFQRLWYSAQKAQRASNRYENFWKWHSYIAFAFFKRVIGAIYVLMSWTFATPTKSRRNCCGVATLIKLWFPHSTSSWRMVTFLTTFPHMLKVDLNSSMEIWSVFLRLNSYHVVKPLVNQIDGI